MIVRVTGLCFKPLVIIAVTVVWCHLNRVVINQYTAVIVLKRLTLETVARITDTTRKILTEAVTAEATACTMRSVIIVVKIVKYPFNRQVTNQFTAMNVLAINVLQVKLHPNHMVKFNHQET